MSYDVILDGGDAHGAYFSGHQLPAPPPPRIDVAVGGESGPALLDLPDDVLELGERVVVYERPRRAGIVCFRGRGGGCATVVVYTAAA